MGLMDASERVDEPNDLRNLRGRLQIDGDGLIEKKNGWFLIAR